MKKRSVAWYAGVGVTFAISLGTFTSATPVSADGNCDVCDDEDVSPVRCLSGEHHRKNGSGATGGWYMPMHNGSQWYCGDCGSDSECPGGGGNPPPGDHEEDPGLAAAIMSGDNGKLLAVLEDMPQYISVNKELGMIGMTDCKGNLIAQYKASADQIAAVAGI
jgi:hypothetical protein